MRNRISRIERIINILNKYAKNGICLKNVWGRPCAKLTFHSRNRIDIVDNYALLVDCEFISKEYTFIQPIYHHHHLKDHLKDHLKYICPDINSTGMLNPVGVTISLHSNRLCFSLVNLNDTCNPRVYFFALRRVRKYGK
jgi:hypothetical protein